MASSGSVFPITTSVYLVLPWKFASVGPNRVVAPDFTVIRCLPRGKLTGPEKFLYVSPEAMGGGVHEDVDGRSVG